MSPITNVKRALRRQALASMAADDRRRQLAAIHAAAAQLGMDTADKSPTSTYRTMLQAQAGTVSAADLDEAGRRKVLAYLLRQLNPTQRPAGKAATQLAYIERLWRELGQSGALRDGSEAGLKTFVRKMHGVDSALWLSAAQGSQVIEALKGWLARHQARA